MKQLFRIAAGSQSLNRSARAAVFFALCSLLLGPCLPAQAQQPAGIIPRVGFLMTSSSTDSESKGRLEAFRQGLRDLGYVEGQNINIEYRYAEGKLERLPDLAAELNQRKADIVVAANGTVARVVKQSSATIPIVMVAAGGFASGQLVASLARPGGNVTGLYQYSPELVGKRLDLLKEIFPKVTRFAFLNSPDGSAAQSAFEDQGKKVAKSLGVQFQLVEVKAPAADLEGAFQAMIKQRIGALVTSSAPLLSFNRSKIIRLAERSRIPAMYPDQQWAVAGGLVSYGANVPDLYRRAATYVDKILKGRKPAELPVEQPTKFHFVINLKTAKQIGLDIPQSVLFRADRVIK